MDEFKMIREIFAPLAVNPGAFGLRDDAASISAHPKNFDLIVTNDQITEGVDFFAFDTPAAVARKALRVNLSDLAAKGAEPAFYFVSLSLPLGADEGWIRAFASGLRDDQDAFEMSLMGGDTGRTDGPLSISIVMMGYVPKGQMLLRSGARVGDQVYVTGTIGDSAGGLQIRKEKPSDISTAHRNFLLDAYHLPNPPVRFSPVLLKWASATIDVSDGLIADLGHVADASGLKLRIDADSVPRSEALRAFWGDGDDAIVRAATAGDDYQIAFTVPPSDSERVMKGANDCSIKVTHIGDVVAGEGVELVREGQILSIPKPGYRHF